MAHASSTKEKAILRRFGGLDGLAGFAPQDGKISIASLTSHWTTLNGFNQSLPVPPRQLEDAISDRQEAYTDPPLA